MFGENQYGRLVKSVKRITRVFLISAIGVVNEIDLSTADSRTENSTVHYLSNISCTYVYFACKSVYGYECGIVRVRGFEGGFGA
ncbi:MAG: hypothetical protein K2N34_08130 [Lachnospiraceae bacterium]|nr:hypothetical protein [Lachnospiraceae bacterium]